MTPETPESELPESEIPDPETAASEASEPETSEVEDTESETPEFEADDSDSDSDDSRTADFDNLRLVEALLFASAEPLAPAQLARFLPEEINIDRLLGDLQALYANRGVTLVKRGGRWAFRTAEDLAPRMELESKVVRKLSRVALETLAVIAYHQPVTRAEVEEIRGVALSKGTLDALLEIGWIRPRGRRKTPGRPVTWGTSDTFLDHFGLESLDALPGVEELKAAGLLDARPALTALSDRGLLPAFGDVTQDRIDDEDEDDESDSEIIEGSERELLEETFGENLLPQEVDLSATPSPEADAAQTADEDDSDEDDSDEDDLEAEAAADDDDEEDDDVSLDDGAADILAAGPDDENDGDPGPDAQDDGDQPQRSTG